MSTLTKNLPKIITIKTNWKHFWKLTYKCCKQTYFYYTQFVFCLFWICSGWKSMRNYSSISSAAPSCCARIILWQFISISLINDISFLQLPNGYKENILQRISTIVMINLTDLFSMKRAKQITWLHKQQISS